MIRTPVSHLPCSLTKIPRFFYILTLLLLLLLTLMLMLMMLMMEWQL
jgi:hypothetical protein